MKYTSNFKPNLLLQPVLFKSAIDNPPLSKVKKSKNNLIKHLTKYIKYEESSFKATSMCFIYTTFKTLVEFNEFSKKNELFSSNNHLSISNLTFFSIKTKTSRFTILRAPYRYKKGRYQVGFKRYSVLCSFDIHVEQIHVERTGTLVNRSITLPIELNRLIFSSVKNISSNTLNLNKVRMVSSLNCPNFFILTSYRK